MCGFFVCMPLRAYAINGWALAGRPSGLPVASYAGSPTLPCARPPIWRWESGSYVFIGGPTCIKPPLVQNPRNLP
ncbi:hypothetical protein DM50_2682 [Burkholderia mallei]|nr:hypothetical protein DM53_3910 [Burkholderia mallei]KOS90974.1 hypothetical protein DM45_2330 [Burkholderia mallei]KOT00175.1 hypothetical protein DM50_2682 [Burkholderia mallei]KOT20436.1 hypothetical protein DM52_1057 [Burkholderia mallei]